MKVQIYSIQTPDDAALCVAAGVADLIGVAPARSWPGWAPVARWPSPAGTVVSAPAYPAPVGRWPGRCGGATPRPR
jgi:hypothetical protein